MRLTAGKIYFWGAVTVVFLTAWNRRSTAQLRTVVDSLKEERMREAEQLRQYQHGDGVAAVGMPKHFNPYHKQQDMESASTGK
ncbi:hypothetical protein NESM_000028000 [Novymonas esmeraldas]|uniref:Uncharacterized protein n=1 Tax=Novymonas esmeraldas TaxID=1808958 RepID=A0AAW0EZI8_9TRYP